MRKINSIKHEKIWGYEIWVYSPVVGMETTFVDDGTKNQGGPLVKIINTQAPLSVQVHPDDTLAKKLENQANGKTESWFILQAAPEANLVMGLKDYNEQVIHAKIANQSFEDLLIKIPIKAQDFFNIPAGLVHGIGKDIELLEVQQPSDTTYRYFDYNRLENGKPRALHIDKAILCQKDLSYVLKPSSLKPLKYINEVGSQTFLQQPTTLKEDMIIIDLKTHDAFVAIKGEIINFARYVLISFK